MTDIDEVIDKTYVQTPKEVIDFLAESVKYVMKTEFGKELDDKDVHILDPFAGTGEFFVQMEKSGAVKGNENLTAYEMSKKRYAEMVENFKARGLKIDTKNIDTFDHDPREEI